MTLQTLNLNDLPASDNDQRFLVVSLPTSENVYVFRVPADTTIKEWGHQMGIEEERGLRVLHFLFDCDQNNSTYGPDAVLMIVNEGGSNEFGCSGNHASWPNPPGGREILHVIWKTGRPDPDFTDRELEETNERTREACCGRIPLIYIT